ncbi:hypothetical protein IJS18_01990 [Candidatus Saccharibacteria bacterium]|nr:hypothetical protein [Candidatus Saccharibacteria bacterium]
MTTGGKNLVILGVASIMVAAVTTGVSLALYHNSGDIYLDRSRPGFLPDEEEIDDNDEPEEEYTFEKSGKITKDVVDEYLKKLQLEIDDIDEYEAPFSNKALTDEMLGI